MLGEESIRLNDDALYHVHIYILLYSIVLTILLMGDENTNNVFNYWHVVLSLRVSLYQLLCDNPSFSYIAKHESFHMLFYMSVEWFMTIDFG